MQPSVLRAMLLMLLSTLLLAVMHAMVRHVGQQLHAFEIAFFRNLFGLLAVLPLFWRVGWRGFATRRPGLHLLRGLTGICAMLGWFYGLTMVPIAPATALSFTAAIFASLGAVVLLGERMRLRRWSAVLIGFIGMLIVLRPGLITIGPGEIAIMFSALCWGLSLVLVKRLSATESTVVIVAWMSVLLTLFSFPAALLVWQWPSLVQLAWLVSIGVLATAGHLAMVGAFQRTETTVLMPLDFTRLLWASAIGYVAFSEIPDIWTWVGGSVIFASAAYISLREAHLARQGKLMARSR
jgi:drug/metabolite transporter (DMT)-like permease